MDGGTVLNKQRKLISVLLMLSMILSMVMFAGCSSKYTSPGTDKDFPALRQSGIGANSGNHDRLGMLSDEE